MIQIIGLLITFFYDLKNIIYLYVMGKEKNSIINKRIKASVISGVAEVLATHPIDYWKTVVQSNKSKTLFKQNPYRGVGVRL